MRIWGRADIAVNLQGIEYVVLENPIDIETYVVATCEEEWDPEDFGNVGPDLYDQNWSLNEVSVKDISVHEQQLKSPAFVEDVTPRIDTQRKLYEHKVPIPPLILRGRDLLIFDGYARWHLFKELGVSKCLAYISSA